MLGQDIHFMQLALVEARKGLGRTSPNPCVGAVIVKDGKILSTGYHKKAGAPHAEINALRQARHDVVGATMYVTLEPCNHTGKTPPCSHAVVKSGISRVVIGMLDPNPLVDGGGRAHLIDNGVEVVTGVLERECLEINRPFMHYMATGRPLVTLKAGISLDGKLNYRSGTPGWITGPASVEKVHRLRDQYDVILVGRKTVEIDNPSLTTRLENDTGRDPVRVVLDPHLKIDPSAKLFCVQSDAKTILFCQVDADQSKMKTLEDKGVRVITAGVVSDGGLDLVEVVTRLGKEGVISILVEGGSQVHNSFLRNRLADRACLFYAPIFAGSAGDSLTLHPYSGGREDALRLASVTYTQLGEDIMVEGEIAYPQPAE